MKNNSLIKTYNIDSDKIIINQVAFLTYIIKIDKIT